MTKKKFVTMYLTFTENGTINTFEDEEFENSIKCRVMLICLKDGSYGIEHYKKIT